MVQHLRDDTFRNGREGSCAEAEYFADPGVRLLRIVPICEEGLQDIDFEASPKGCVYLFECCDVSPQSASQGNERDDHGRQGRHVR